MSVIVIFCKRIEKWRKFDTKLEVLTDILAFYCFPTRYFLPTPL